ncbi:MAG: monovalent cation/H(+) antiporter subunit G [Rickettsiaceae bacterium]|nr:monovalent cation/H(+) antiporter subunit G [Rickettsiaceae bacterium]
MLSLFGWGFISIGCFFIVSSIIGLFRMKDVYMKMHSASVSDSLGIPLCLLGLAMMQHSLLNSGKIIAIVILFFILTPTNTHSLAAAIWKSKKRGKQ